MSYFIYSERQGLRVSKEEEKENRKDNKRENGQGIEVRRETRNERSGAFRNERREGRCEERREERREERCEEKRDERRCEEKREPRNERCEERREERREEGCGCREERHEEHHDKPCCMKTETEKLAGAKFVLKTRNGCVVACGKTNGCGEIEFGNLPFGNYLLQEIEAPDGYEFDKKPIPVEICHGDPCKNVEIINEKKKGRIKVIKFGKEEKFDDCDDCEGNGFEPPVFLEG